jgi:hypothetical protein
VATKQIAIRENGLFHNGRFTELLSRCRSSRNKFAAS